MEAARNECKETDGTVASSELNVRVAVYRRAWYALKAEMHGMCLRQTCMVYA